MPRIPGNARWAIGALIAVAIWFVVSGGLSATGLTGSTPPAGASSAAAPGSASGGLAEAPPSASAGASVDASAGESPLGVGPDGYPTPGQLVQAAFVRIVDGDTIKVELNGAEVTVRYIGMDTPETVRPGTPVQWMGEEAASANEALLERGGGSVYLEKDVSETDRYGRLLRYVWIRSDGRWAMVNLELLREGFARVSTFPPDVKDIDPWFLDAERQAHDAGLGLWGPTPAPSVTGSGGANVNVVVCGGNKNAPGDDNLNLNGEYVVVCNSGAGSVGLGGWTLTDEGARHTYRFPTFTLRAGARVTIYSGSGTNTSTALFWRSDGAIWNNDGDCAHLFDPSGRQVSSRCL